MVIWILSGLVVLLIGYIMILQSQFRRINRKLEKRETERTRQVVSVEFINHELTRLAENINTCLKTEESLRLDVLHEEREFRELIANISHDLRTPLTAVKGYLQLLGQSLPTAEQQEKLDIARKHVLDLEQLIEHFFEYSYLIGTEPVLTMERFNLTNLISEYLAESYLILESHGRPLIFHESQPVFAYGDRESVKRVFQNLLRNCLQHGIGDIEVEVHGGEKAVFLIRNEIEDLRNLEVDKIFRRFYSGDKARRASTGLGLSIVNLLVTQMGGTACANIEQNKLEIKIELSIFDSTKGLL